MSLSAGRIRSINYRLAQAEALAFPIPRNQTSRLSAIQAPARQYKYSRPHLSEQM